MKVDGTVGAELKSRAESSRDETPSPARFLVLAVLCAAASVAYLCRNSIGVAESTIREELDLTESQMGWVMSSFFLAYALGQLPLGWLGKQLGARKAIAGFAAVWSLATAAMSLATGGWAATILLGSRIGNGVAQAGLFPACTASIGRWFPKSTRAVASGSLSSFMSIGGAVGVALTGILVVQLGWRVVFAGYGLAGLAFAVLFLLLFPSPPTRGVSGRIETNENPSQGKPTQENPTDAGERVSLEREPAWPVFLAPPTWWICGQQFCRAAGQIFFSSWFATYLQETRGVTVASSGYLNSLPLLGIVAGAFIGGAVSDGVLHWTGSRRLARSGVAAISMLLCAAFVFAAYFIIDPVLAVVMISCGTFCAAIGGPCAYTVTIDMGGKNVAVLFATMNMIGNLGAFAFIRAVPQLVEVASWDSVLALFAAQMAGTFLVLVVQPDVAFTDGNPLLLTVEGEFVIKNLVLLSAGMVIGATVRRRSEREPESVDGSEIDLLGAGV